MPLPVPALPQIPSNVVHMPQPGTRPPGIVKIDVDALHRLADKLEDDRAAKGITIGRQPGKRPSITVDPLEVKKLEDLLGKEATEALRGCDHAELRERIVLLSEHEVETEQAKKNDEELKGLKAQVGEMEASYKETLKFLKARRRFAVLLMQERGRVVPK